VFAKDTPTLILTLTLTLNPKTTVL